MQKVLIYTDTNTITNAKHVLTNMIPYVQQLHDEFLAVGVTVTLNDLKPILYSALRIDVPTENIITQFVNTYLIDKAGNQSFNGVGVNIESLIKKPDLSSIFEKVNDYPNMDSRGLTGFNPALMQIIDGVVDKTATAFTEIEEMFTYYSENDRGAESAMLLFDLAQQLNEARVYFNLDPYSNQFMEEVYGLEIVDNSYRPSLKFIRSQEKSYADYIAPGQPED